MIKAIDIKCSEQQIRKTFEDIAQKTIKSARVGNRSISEGCVGFYLEMKNSYRQVSHAKSE